MSNLYQQWKEKHQALNAYYGNPLFGKTLRAIPALDIPDDLVVYNAAGESVTLITVRKNGSIRRFVQKDSIRRYSDVFSYDIFFMEEADYQSIQELMWAEETGSYEE